MINLVIGASGFVGNFIYSQLKKEGKNVFGTYYSNKKPELIKTNMTSISDLEFLFKKFKPDLVYLPAFIPGVDYCELNDEPNRINQLGITNIVNICKNNRIKLIFFSTDYIFDGKSGPYLEIDEPNPINKYGKTKLICENMVKELKNFLIIRTTVVYGYDIPSKNFLMTLYSDLKNGLKRKVPVDQFSSPTFVEDLASISIELAEKNKTGIYNVTGPDYCSRYVFALKAARTFELDENLITPLSTEELKQPAKRPLKAGLIIDKIRTEINANPLGIDMVLKNLKLHFNNTRNLKK